MAKKKAATQQANSAIGQEIGLIVATEQRRPETVREAIAQQVANLHKRANDLESKGNTLPGALLDLAPSDLESAGIVMYGF